MADVLIRGMKMPETCNGCLFSAMNVHWKTICIIGGTYCDSKPSDNCPLIEVPPHGRLIDADELRSEYKAPMDWLDRTQVMYHVTGIWASIDAAPTVIPEEPPKEGT